MAVTAWLRSMHRRCFGCWIWFSQYAFGNLSDWSRSFDIPVPQIEEEIAEVDRFLHCVKQYLEPLL